MIFPSDAEIREYATYEVRTRKIILEEFKHEYGGDGAGNQSSGISGSPSLPKYGEKDNSLQSETNNLEHGLRREACLASGISPRVNPAIEGLLSSLSGHFISLISVRSRQDSAHGKEKQTVFSSSLTRPIPGDYHQSRLKSFFSLLLSRKYRLIRLSERKYEKVGKFMRRNGITW